MFFNIATFGVATAAFLKNKDLFVWTSNFCKDKYEKSDS